MYMQERLRYWLDGSPCVHSLARLQDDGRLRLHVFATWYGGDVWSRTEFLIIDGQHPEIFAVSLATKRLTASRDAHDYLATLVGKESPWK